MISSPSPSNDRPRTRRQALKRYLIWFAVGYGGLIVIFSALQRKLIYLPSQVERIELSDAGELASVVEHVTIETDDGLTLNGWYVPARGETKATVVYLPGNAANRINRIGFLTLLREAGAASYLFDYRGYGENKGFPSEEAIARDSRLVYDFVVENGEHRTRPTVLWGQSLGGGVAVRLAQEMCIESRPPSGLITVATFSSAVDVGKRQFPWLPVNWLMIDRFESARRIGDVTCPILQLHGTNDRIVPMTLGKKLHEAAPTKSDSGVPKRFVELPGSGHNDILFSGQPQFGRAVREFINAVSVSGR